MNAVVIAVERVLDGIQIQAADTPNANGRIYPRAVLEKLCEISVVYGCIRSEMTREASLMLEDPSKYSHVVTNLRMENDWLVGDVKILDTPCGHVLQELLATNVNIDFVSRSKVTFAPGLLKGCRVVETCWLLGVDAVNQRA